MRNECQTRRRPRQWSPSSRYVCALEAVDFHFQALRYRAGLSHRLNAEEQQVCRHARRAVEEFMRGRHDAAPDALADWLATWCADLVARVHPGGRD